MVMHPVDVTMAELAERQYLLFSRGQVLAAGGTDALIRRRRQSGLWLTPGPGVYSLAGGRTSYLRSLWLAHLSAGPHSTVSHESAAALSAFTGFPRQPVVLTVPHPLHPRVNRTTVHQISDLEPRWIWRLGDLPVTVPARTFVEGVAATVEDVGHQRRLSRQQLSDSDSCCLESVSRRSLPSGAR
jgi:hypothetical protein